MLNEQERTICICKCWLNSQLASSEALLSLESTIDDPTPSWSAVPFFVWHKNDIRQRCVISFVFSYHIGGTCPVKEFSWPRNGAFFGTAKKPPRTFPSESKDQEQEEATRCCQGRLNAAERQSQKEQYGIDSSVWSVRQYRAKNKRIRGSDYRRRSGGAESTGFLRTRSGTQNS